MYIRKVLEPGERIAWAARPDPYVALGLDLKAVAGVMIAFAVFMIGNSLATLVALFIAIYALRRPINRLRRANAAVYLVTDRRVLSLSTSGTWSFKSQQAEKCTCSADENVIRFHLIENPGAIALEFVALGEAKNACGRITDILNRIRRARKAGGSRV
jgi:hypothetical protein